ncbi:MAG: phosphatase PAP2 family protein [Spirochaetia bacterium]|jgi:membrane-associated phospholipid phosphatase
MSLANVVLILGVFYVVLNTVVYNWTGSLYATGFHLNTALDNIIPFAPEWAIFYLYLFYPLSALTMAYFAFVDYRRGYALAFSLILINLAADIVYAVFPVTTDIYRQALLAHPLTGNFFASAMYAHYASDPSFDCFPSLHAAVATICFYAWYRYAKVRPHRITRGIAVGMFVIAAGVVLSTLFVKQHYIADEIAGIALAWGIGRWMFDAFWKTGPAGRRTGTAP